ncbi:hypothetical protein FRC07_002146 [Ceratobasidium sp. 392]|nr:hypothetical protein FRC07_002146 [Ceratobasidium sp. 392]
MGFIAQTFGNSFWSSSTGQAEIQQRAAPTARKYRPKQKITTRINPAIPLLSGSSPPTQSSSVRKKRRHASPEATPQPPDAGIGGDPGRPSMSSSSVASDEPLILPSPKGKGKAAGSSPISQSNPNQSAYGTGTWSNFPQSPPRLQARPPTTNSLDTYERSQLVRRSRKLGAILGETPRLLDVGEDDKDVEEALSQVEPAVAVEPSCQRPSNRRSLTLGATPIGSTLSASTPVSISRHSFLLNDENASSFPVERNSHRNSGSGPRFGRSRSTARCPPVLRLSLTPTRENAHPYFSRRHSSDLSIRRGSSLNNVDMNVGPENDSNVSISKAQSLDTSSICSSTMPTFARPRSPSSFLDSGSISSRISLHESIGVTSVCAPSRSEVVDYSLPPTPTTPLTPVLTQAEDARRKMRKLARHLGESVPADLVLGNAGGRHAPHDLRMEAAAPQFLQVPSKGFPINSTKGKTGRAASFSLGKPPVGHRKAQSVWRGNTSSEVPASGRRLVRRASSAEQLRIDSTPSARMTSHEKARNVHRAMKMLQLFGAPPPHELYTNARACSLDLPPHLAHTAPVSPVADRRASINSFRDLAYILDHDNRNSLLALIGDDMSDTQDDPALSPFADTFASGAASAAHDNEESFEARRARANKLAKFFGVSYRDLFDAVCGDDASQPDGNQAGPGANTSTNSTQESQRSLPASGSEVMTNNGVKWVEPKSVDEVLDRLRNMKTSR